MSKISTALDVYTSEEERMQSLILSMSITPITPVQEPALNVAHFTVARANYLQQKAPELIVYGYLWDIAKLFVGWCVHEKELLELNKTAFNELLDYWGVEPISMANMSLVIGTTSELLKDLKWVSDVYWQIGYKNIALTPLTQEILNEIDKVRT